MPEGSLWWGADLIPNLLSPARERGGWANASNDIAAVTATASTVVAGIYANYVAGGTLIAIDEDGRLYKVASNGTVTDVGSALLLSQNPVFHRDKVIVMAFDGTTAPKKVTNAAGTLTIANLGGSPPTAIFATVFKDRTVLGNTAAQPQRLYFSDPGDPEGWDVTNTYVDFNNPITALAAVRNFVLVWSDSTMSRLYGSSPPPDSDFVVNDPMFEVGCTDARSVAVSGDKVVFANAEGLYLTDGSIDPVNLTALCGMLTYWQDQLAGYTKSNWTIVGGFLRDDYYVCVMNQTAIQLCARIDIAKRAWWPLTNVDARSMWKAEAASDELYFGRRNAARVGKLSTIYTPSATVKNDGDGDAVASVIETPFYEGDGSEKGWVRLYTTLELTDYASDNPTLAVSYIKTPEETSYTAISGALSEGTTRATKRKDLGFASDGVAFKLTRANAGDFLLYGLSVDAKKREGSRHNP